MNDENKAPEEGDANANPPADGQEGDAALESGAGDAAETNSDGEGQDGLEPNAEGGESTDDPADGAASEAGDDSAAVKPIDNTVDHKGEAGSETVAAEPEDDALIAARAKAAEVLEAALDECRDLGVGCWVIIPEHLRHPSIVQNHIDLLDDGADVRVK